MQWDRSQLRHIAAAERHSRKWTATRLAIAAMVPLCWVVAAAWVPTAQTPPPVRLAGFNPLAPALVETLGEQLQDLAMAVAANPPSGTVAGGVASLQALQNGSTELALTFANVAYTGYIGRLDDSRTRYDRVRGIAVLYLTPMHLVARREAPIFALPDLRGHVVTAGQTGSATPLTASLALRAVGLSDRDISQRWLTYTEAADSLRKGEVDAMFVNQGYPSEQVHAVMQAGARLLDLTGPAIERLRAEYPFLRAALIPENTYPNQPRAVKTIGIDTLLVCRADLDEGLVYRLTRGLFATLPQLTAVVPALRRMELARAAAVPIPLHPGAARYYRERELSR